MTRKYLQMLFDDSWKAKFEKPVFFKEKVVWEGFKTLLKIQCEQVDQQLKKCVSEDVRKIKIHRNLHRKHKTEKMFSGSDFQNSKKAFIQYKWSSEVKVNEKKLKHQGVKVFYLNKKS